MIRRIALGYKRLAMACGGGVMMLSLCTGGQNSSEFRSAVIPGIESGVLAILEGDAAGLESIVDSFIMGIFEVFTPD